MDIDELLKIKEFNNITDPEKQVTEKQAKYPNEITTHLDKYAIVNAEEKTGDASVDPKK